MTNKNIHDAKSNLISAFEYLLHLDKMRAKPIYKLSDHKLPFFHEDNFSDLPGVENNLIEGESEIWIQIRRLRAEPPPEVPDILRPWLILKNDPTVRPNIQEVISLSVPERATDENREPPDPAVLKLEDEPEVQEAFEEYCDDSWKPWSEAEIPRRKTIAFYDRIFSLQQDVEAGGASEDAIEIAWGLGMALWSHPESGISISYPLISKLVEIQIDETTLSLNVLPAGREPVVHSEPFLAVGIAQADDLVARATQEFETAESTLSPFDRSTFDGILRFAVSKLDSHGVYWPEAGATEGNRKLPLSKDHLTVSDTWVLFARRRGTNFIAADIQRMKAAVEGGADIPAALGALVTMPTDTAVDRPQRHYRGISTPGIGGGGYGLGGLGPSGGSAIPETTGHTHFEDLYFPKPFNAEQVTIVDRIEQADGVVVQGPPGTGKSHTIANIISHYLATGRRVLVTASHESPLVVLRDHIPEPLRPLTISLLTSEREGLKLLEQSVRKIAGDIGRLNASDLDQQIQGTTDHIDQLYERLASLDHDLAEWGRKQTSEVPFLGDRTRPEALAKRVVGAEQAHKWFPDELTGEKPPTPGINDVDIEALRSARPQLGEDLVYLKQDLPHADQLPLPEDMVRLHEDLKRYQELQHSVIEAGDVPPLRQYSSQILKKAEELRKLSDKIDAFLRAGSSPWHIKARKFLSLAPPGPLTEHLRVWVKAVVSEDSHRQTFLADGIELPDGSEADEALYQAVSRVSDGKRPFGLIGGDKKAKGLFREIRIGGAVPKSPEHWKRILEYLNFTRKVRGLLAQWSQINTELEGPDVVAMPAATTIKRLAELARPLVGLWEIDERLAEPLMAQAREVFSAGFEFEKLTEDRAELTRLIDALAAHLQHSRLKMVKNELLAIHDAVSNAKGPVIDMIKDCLEQMMGNPEVSAEALMGRWGAVHVELKRLRGLQGNLHIVESVTESIAKSGAPNWAHMLQGASSEDDDQDLLPLNWRDSWEWARAKGYLDAINGREALQQLARDRMQAEEDLSKANLNIVEMRTWRKLKENMTGSISAALQSYLTAITRIGRGTGMRATRYRRDAQNAMKTAYGAVPCWIMPHWRVSEALPPEFGLFDLVIIDEASQSDAWALPAIARAKKILVVGDDKQVSPSDVGMAEADTLSLQRKYLKALPYGEHLLPGASIYDLASTLFATDIIRLREHFRCVEPIIAFSNHMFYEDEIRPLRIPKPSERLDPPLIDVYVKGGYRSERKKINKPEARFIVEEVGKITSDPSMTTRTIGVVSLLGKEQAKHIYDELLSHLGEEVILRHNIRCGDAMHFQGKEADIVFISMVAAGKITAATGRTYEQRYNVACSRPRDRLYVVRSFTREELSDKDLRAKLLDHLNNPMGFNNIDAEDLRDLCESNFEREVFDVLVERGYRVTPQVKAGGYRIDMVVEGRDDYRLAIECDGDQYHGVDRWMYDISRQRVLERMGWQFWRCWGSSWSVERESCIRDLLEILSERGINPIGMEGKAKGGLVEHRVIDPELKREKGEDEVQLKPRGDLTIAGLGFEEDISRIVPTQVVELGSTVRFADVDNPKTVKTAMIVTLTSDPSSGTINQHTPLAEALLGSEVGDEVEAFLPTGSTMLRILDITPRKAN